MFVEASIVVGAILCAKAGAMTYAYVYHRESFDRQCANCERATSGFDGGDEKETGKETGDDERGTSEEPSAPKRMKDVKKGRSFKKMFSSKKKKTGGFRGLDDNDDAKKS